MRDWLLIRLVRLSARWWDASYATYVRCDKGEMPWWWHKVWTWGALRVEHVALPVARRLNDERNVMGAEMAEHAWWG